MNDADLNDFDDNLDVENINSVRYDDETIVWEGKPSQWVNIGTYIWWSIFLIAASTFLYVWANGYSSKYSYIINESVQWVCYGLIIVSILSMMHAFLYVHYEYTIITHNKITEKKGITRYFQQVLFCEISDIKDIKSPPAGLLSLVGLSNLVIETVDDDQPLITIRAIEDRDKLISRLHPIWRKLRMERKGYFGDR